MILIDEIEHRDRFGITASVATLVTSTLASYIEALIHSRLSKSPDNDCSLLMWDIK